MKTQELLISYKKLTIDYENNNNNDKEENDEEENNKKITIFTQI